jgi:2,3-bisphosphoglycerate-independent phosphoglycerate mutase
VANLSVLGYPPREYYTGRSSLEAVSIGVQMVAGDISLRANLVTLSDEPDYKDKSLLDYSGGEIGTAEAHILIDYLKEHLDVGERTLFPGVSFRNILLWHKGPLNLQLTPAHDITGQPVRDYLPKGPGSDIITACMIKSYEMLSQHPLNQQRKEKGLPPANGLWFWGLGTAPLLPPFKERYKLDGSVVCAVDLIKGIGLSADMSVPDVPGATGNFHTNYEAKAKVAIQELTSDSDFCFIHVEAPDESGHQGKLDEKIASIEKIDQLVLAPLVEFLKQKGEDFRILVMPDHETPMKIRTHASNPVPFVIYDSRHHRFWDINKRFDEESVKESSLFYKSGQDLFQAFLDKEFY